MAALAVEAPTGDLHNDVIRWYRDLLALPAVFPWHDCRYQPVRIGPTWQTDADGLWVLPDATIGWDVLGFCGSWMQHGPGDPWKFTLEQARFILWLYAVDETGRFLFHSAILQRLKGHGKDPLAATIGGTELVGPARVAYMDGDTPVATTAAEPWVQTAAVNLEQTKNLMKLYPSLWTKEAVAEFRLQIGKEKIYAADGAALMEAVTSSPAPLEGARSSMVILNETHQWRSNNSGHDMAEVIERNSAKSAEGAARTLSITNAFEPGEDSVAERDRVAFEQATDGESLTEGLLYDSLEAPPEAPLHADYIEDVVRGTRGDSTWLDIPRIRRFVLDTRNAPSKSRRFWFNQITAAEDAWIVPQQFDALVSDVEVEPHERVVMFFDGSKSDDATGLVGCRVSDGHVFTLGMWQRPPGRRGEGWVVPKSVVDERVREVLEVYNVSAFWGDPSHVLDDETQDRFWDEIFDGWHRDYKRQFTHKLWAVQSGVNEHSIMWDMAASKRVAEFTDAAQRTSEDVEQSFHAVQAGRDATITHDGDGRLKRHVHNARRYPNRFGVSVWKGHRESSRKIDLAVCMIGARMLRRKVLLSARQRNGVVY